MFVTNSLKLFVLMLLKVFFVKVLYSSSVFRDLCKTVIHWNKTDVEILNYTATYCSVLTLIRKLFMKATWLKEFFLLTALEDDTRDYC